MPPPSEHYARMAATGKIQLARSPRAPDLDPCGYLWCLVVTSGYLWLPVVPCGYLAVAARGQSDFVVNVLVISALPSIQEIVAVNV
jgi:hypothetical protein